jgi:hypothetical protein
MNSSTMDLFDFETLDAHYLNHGMILYFLHNYRCHLAKKLFLANESLE